MNRNGKILAGAAVLLALGSAAAVAHRQGGWHGKGHHGMGGMHMGFGGPMGRFCKGDLAERTDYMLVRIEHRVKPTDAQKPGFEEFKSAMKAAAAKVAAACPAAPQAAATDTGEDKSERKRVRKELPERLADTEAQLTAALDALKTVRPAAEKLYATLDQAQKDTVSKMGMRGKHMRGDRKSWGGGWRDRDREDRRGPRMDRGAPSDAPETDGGSAD